MSAQDTIHTLSMALRLKDLEIAKLVEEKNALEGEIEELKNQLAKASAPKKRTRSTAKKNTKPPESKPEDQDAPGD